MDPALSFGYANLLSVLPLLPVGPGKRKTFGINVAFFGEKKVSDIFHFPDDNFTKSCTDTVFYI